MSALIDCIITARRLTMVMAGCAVLVGWRVGVVGNVGAPQHVVSDNNYSSVAKLMFLLSF